MEGEPPLPSRPPPPPPAAKVRLSLTVFKDGVELVKVRLPVLGTATVGSLEEAVRTRVQEVAGLELDTVKGGDGCALYALGEAVSRTWLLPCFIQILSPS